MTQLSENTSDVGNKSGKIEHILRSIRGIIDSHGTSSMHDGSMSAEATKGNIYNDSDEEKLEQKADAKIDFSAEEEAPKGSKEEVLELTSEINARNINSYLISEEVKKVVQEEVVRLKNANEQISATNAKLAKMDIFTAELLMPIIKEWVDAHLPAMVEKIVSQEIKNIIHNK